MNRRHFLGYLGTAAAIVALAPSCSFEQTIEISWSSLARGVTGLDDQQIEAIARAAMGSSPGSRWRAELPIIDHIIWTDAGLETNLREDKLFKQLQETCSKQYANDDYQLAGVWILSNLEVALSVLAQGTS